MRTSLALTERPADEMISAAVRGLIAQRRLKAPQVALAVGIGRTTFYKRLDNVTAWEAAEVDRLARFFDVSRDSLYEGRADFVSVPAGSVADAFGARSSTDRASDYGSGLGRFWSPRSPRSPRSPCRRSSDRHKHMHVVPLTLMDGQAS